MINEEFEHYINTMPIGWQNITKDFLSKLSYTIQNNPTEYVDFHILDMKEKYGQGRCYVSYTTPEIEKLIEDWEYITSKTCVECRQ